MQNTLSSLRTGDTTNDSNLLRPAIKFYWDCKVGITFW